MMKRAVVRQRYTVSTFNSPARESRLSSAKNKSSIGSELARDVVFGWQIEFWGKFIEVSIWLYSNVAK